MEQKLIFYPILVMVLLTTVAYVILIRARYRAFDNKEVQAGYFKALQGNAPDHLVAAGRNVMNLFELPLLFYVAGITAYVTQTVDMLLLAIAWVFTLSRCWHSYIHLGRNHVQKRMNAFLLGAVAIVLMWLLLAWRLLNL